MVPSSEEAWFHKIKEKVEANTTAAGVTWAALGQGSTSTNFIDLTVLRSPLGSIIEYDSSQCVSSPIYR